jgi:REP element-mobilizing transposase RayT|tara:strand:- start:6196 stop:6654 length:459 start_codon:yes stop_codon:yes gene_type:complete
MPLHRSHHLRRNRSSEPYRTYLVTTTTAGRVPWFLDFEAGRRVVAALRYCDQAGWCTTWTFVVMPDHLHWLFELGEELPLSTLVGRMKSYASRQVRHVSGGQGRVWQPGYHDHALRREEDLAATARYVVGNPVRAGLVRSVRDYPLWDAAWL